MRNVFQPLLAFALATLVLTTSFRTLLIAWQFERVGSLQELLDLYYWGLRIDLQTIGIVSVLYALWSFLSAYRPTQKLWQRGTVCLLWGFFVAALVMESSTPAFIQQYDVRPNRLYFEYLERPVEVIGMLASGFALVSLLALASSIVGGWWFYRHLRGHTHAVEFRSGFKQAAQLTLILALGFLASRGTVFAHRPLNPANASVSSDALLNDLALNSLYSVAYAAYNLKHENELDKAYGKMSDEEMLARVKASMPMPESAFLEPASILHRQAAPAGSHPNVVIILEESLGAEFVGALGGADLTPNIDRFAERAWWFDRLYATGTRSVRGIEAVISGFPPSPARAAVKLSGAQHNFFTLARAFNQAGYHSQFVYGGDANFDNMRRFLANNGFQEVIENKDFDNPVFEGVWGASDEDLLNRVHAELLEESPEPRFIFAFSSSNHEPFEYPDARIQAVGEPTSVDNAVRYADWAIGDFLNKAQASAYWDNTIILVVADHNSRVYGEQLVPIRRFQIPAFFVGGSITPKRTKNIVSQLDLPPTLLALAGIEAVHPMPGCDLTQTPLPNRAQMQFYKRQAYMQDDQVVVLQPHQEPTQWTFDGSSLMPSRLDPELARTALAYARLGPYLYRRGLYHAKPIDLQAATN